MKNTFFMLFFSIAISFIACGGSGENDENLLAGNGNTEKPKEDESQEPVVCSITPIGELNQGTPIINSHADVTKRSSLMMNYRMLVTMESSYPRYPRIKKMKLQMQKRQRMPRQKKMLRIQRKKKFRNIIFSLLLKMEQHLKSIHSRLGIQRKQNFIWKEA